MTESGSAHPLRTFFSTKRWLLGIAAGAFVAGCGGGGGGGNSADTTPPVSTPQPQPPRVTLSQGQFTAEAIEGLGFRVPGVTEGTTDASGKFNFVAGQPV